MNTIEIVCYLISAVGVVLGGVWFIVNKAMKIGEMNRKLYGIEEKTKHSNCERNTGSIDKLENNLYEINKDVAYLRASLETWLTKSDAMVQSHSPISLTDLGKQIAHELEAEKIIENSWDKILKQIEANDTLSNPYDIQQYCIEEALVSPESFFKEVDLDTIKRYAYKRGEIIQMYMRVFGILIRDRYFREKNIEALDVDKHDPIKVQEK